MATAEVIAKAKEKIAREVNEYEDLKRESGFSVIMPTDERSPFKEYLFQRIETVNGFAEKVLQDCKTIEKGLAYSAKKIPEKVKKLGMVHLSTEDVFALFCEYYDWDEEAERLKKEAEQKKREEKRKSSSNNGGTESAPFDLEAYRKQQAEAEAARQAKKKEEEEAKKRKALGICEGQQSLFDLFGFDPQPAQEVSEPVIRPVERKPVESVPEPEPVSDESDDDETDDNAALLDIFDLMGM